MNQRSPADTAEAWQARENLITRLREQDAVRTREVEDAFRAVPRHLFAPEASMEEAYLPEKAVITKRDAGGVAVSSVSAARIQALMLEQARIRPGMRVLEIGSGGCNAALIAELAGQTGEVTTIDIDPDVTSRASRLLDATGYGHVNVVTGDGEYGEPAHAPYDRIVVTVGAADIPPAWISQLAPGGRLVVPLRARGLTRSIPFETDDGCLIGRGYQQCGFVAMRGAGTHPERRVGLHDGASDGEPINLRVDDDRQISAAGLREAFAMPGTDAWSGLTMAPMTPFSDLDLWLATTMPGHALLDATRQARDQGLVATWSGVGVAALVEGDSFAYLQYRPVNPQRSLFEFGARGHGPEAAATAARLAAEIAGWGTHSGDRANFRVYPAGTPGHRIPAGLTVTRKHARINISWPAAGPHRRPT